MRAIEKTLIEGGIDTSKTRFCCLDSTNSMSGKHKCLENIYLQEILLKHK